jgi:integrase
MSDHETTATHQHGESPDGDDPLTNLVLVPSPAESRLNQRQYDDYRHHRKRLAQWLLTFGKDPETATGYRVATVDVRLSLLDKFYRWVWDQRGYTTQITHDDADDYLREFAYQDYSATYKVNTQNALKALFRWQTHERGDPEWDPDISFTKTSDTSPRDYFTLDERRRIREASLEYGTVPHYKSLSPDDRDEWRVHLAQRFQKPLYEVEPADWDRANGYKIPSLVHAALDAGLRPIEVERATPEWVDVDNAVLRIPKDESSKNREHWQVSLTERTATMLDRWLDERPLYDTYSQSNHLWLSREGNPYLSSSLKYILLKLCELAGIDTENRSLSWYAIRHSTGTYMTREEDLAAAQAQLRHTSPQTTMKYDQTPVEDRRNALDRM